MPATNKAKPVAKKKTTKAATPKPKPSPAPAGRSIYAIRRTKASRPVWKAVAEKVIGMKSTDIKVFSIGDFHSLRRAVMQRGFYVWRHHLEESVWILRLSTEPTAARDSPLKREYTRSYSTAHGRWVHYADELMAGREILLPTRQDVTVMGINLRKYYPPDKFPPRTLQFEEHPPTGNNTESQWRVWVTFN